MALWLYFLFKLICTHVIKEGGVKIASDREKKKMTEMLKLKIIWDTQFSGWCSHAEGKYFLEDLAQNKGVLKWQKLCAPAAPPVIKYEHSTQKETRLPIYFTSQRVFRHDLHWRLHIKQFIAIIIIIIMPKLIFDCKRLQIHLPTKKAAPSFSLFISRICLMT